MPTVAILTVWVEHPVCDACGTPLRVDLETVAALVRCGLAGGRWRCPLGCTELWIKVPIQSERPILPERRGHYERPMRTIRCRRCGTDVTTRGYNTKMCPECSKEDARERERRRTARARPSAAP